MDKQSLRICAKNKRKELDMENISTILVNKLVQTQEYKKSKNIMIFYPMPEEVNLLKLLKDSTKQFYLPRIKGDELECCPYKIGDELCESCFHTLEPICQACSKTEIDLIIVPALAVDKNKYRLGYGKGFYDRLLRDFDGIKISCIPHELMFDTVFPDIYDEKIDIIIDSK